MSTLGNIKEAYGKKYNIGVANASSNIVMNSGNLPKNSIIISSPVDRNNEDTGTYSLIMIDNESNPVRLTYAIEEGNGLVVDGDVISVGIDNNTIKSNENDTLYINSNSLVDDDTITVKENKMSVNTSSLKTGSKTAVGVFLIDGKTLSQSDGLIFVDSTELDISNNISKGLFLGDNKTIKATQGKLSVVTENLDKATDSSLGIISCDENTILSNGGDISINEDNLTKVSASEFGLAKGDEKTIHSDNGILSVSTEGLEKGDSSKYGTIKIDGKTIILNEDSQISVNNYSTIDIELTSYHDEFANINSDVEGIKDELKNILNI